MPRNAGLYRVIFGATVGAIRLCMDLLGFREITSVMENQLAKKMRHVMDGVFFENEWKLGLYRVGICVSENHGSLFGAPRNNRIGGFYWDAL